MSNMSNDDDAFPNAEQLFRRAFDHPNAPSELLKLIKQYPSYDTVVDLLVCYTFVAEENPECVEALANILVAVRDAPDAPLFGGKPALRGMFNRKLIDLHCLALDDAAKPFGPTNPFLIGSLLSGWSFKCNLSACSDQYGPLFEGLDADPTSSSAEVMVTGACIQLLIAGSIIIPNAKSYIESRDEVAVKLKGQMAASTVKNVDALKLLELTIGHAEAGFKEEDDIRNVWQLLFPVQA